jgi:hypothetical protein
MCKQRFVLDRCSLLPVYIMLLAGRPGLGSMVVLLTVGLE